MKISPVGAESFDADRRTDRYDEASSRFSQFFESAKETDTCIVISWQW
jgi:hypothetical protein